MAGSINDNGVFWNVGDTTGRDNNGNTANLPTPATVVGVGSATPTTAPAGAPLYLDSDNDDLFVWNGTAWDGPYNKGT